MECKLFPKFPEKETKFIWKKEQIELENQYVEFSDEFIISTLQNVNLYIYSDSRSAIYVNEQFVGLELYDSSLNRRIYERFVLDKYLILGKNTIKIQVYYQGRSSNNYIKYRPELCFAIYSFIEKNWVRVIESREETLCRNISIYKNGNLPTNQIGFVWQVDASKEKPLYEKSFCYSKQGDRTFEIRNWKKQILLGQTKFNICNQGLFIKGAKSMESDYLSYCDSPDIFERDIQQPYYFIVDLGEEDTGFFHLILNAPKGTRLEISYGEHLDDLRVRSKIGQRNFECEYICKEGEQEFTHYFSRFGCRYIEIHVFPTKLSKIEWKYVGIIPVRYPVEQKGKIVCGDHLHQKIAEVCINTLQLCMHEHYDDCPWREQGLYSSDMMNQALCGYYCFGEYEFAKQSLRLLGDGLREDGFLELHAPGEDLITIPYYTFTWIMAIRDYYLYSGDLEFINQMWDKIAYCVHTRMHEIVEGILPTKTEKEYWNFYDWTDDMSGEPIYRDRKLEDRLDLPYMAFFLMMLEAVAYLAKDVSDSEICKKIEKTVPVLQDTINRIFWNADKNYYETYAYRVGGTWKKKEGKGAQLTQALAILSGCADRHQNLEKTLLESNDMIKVSLGMIGFKYEALIKCGEQNIDKVFEEIALIWGSMLYHGAITFWETEDGADAFDKAGSLCHGWSAMPIYFYFAYGLGIKPLEPGFRKYSQKIMENSLFIKEGIVPTPWGEIK